MLLLGVEVLTHRRRAVAAVDISCKSNRMRVLALDTTTRAGSVALVDDERVVDERSGDAPRPHAERLPGEIIALLAAHGVAVADVDLFAVASGPGSFTGLRIGIATIQGLAFVRQRPVVAVSALEALAQLGSRDSSRRRRRRRVDRRTPRRRLLCAVSR